MSTEEHAVVLAKGANATLRALGAELGAVTAIIDTRTTSEQVADADVSVLLLDAAGRVRTSDDFVFYNQPIAFGGAVHLREKIRTEDDAAVVVSDIVTLELDDVPDEIERIVVSASLDPGTGLTFGDVGGIKLRVQRTADAQDLVEFPIADVTTERALLFGEFYRRNGEWRVRAIGQGYEGGLEALVTDFGVDVAGDAGAEEATSPTDGTDEPVGKIPGVDEEIQGIGTTSEQPVEGAADTVPELPEQRPTRAVSVRRPTRAPRLAADWATTIPAANGDDWQTARLFPVAGIGGGEEQERRATSAFLAVVKGVTEFGRAFVSRCGGPAGSLATYIEVPFGQDEEAYRPDGLIRVTRGQREWTALVEVKTGDGKLAADQIDHYVDIARNRGFDAVITISNQLTGADGDHPVAVDRRKLRKITLLHVSWDEIRALGTLTAKHRGVNDPTQRWILDEFLRYMSHQRSGMNGMVDMGQHWVKVRDAVKAKTARSTDRSCADVSARFDQLVQHVGFDLSSLLGVDVQSIVPRKTPDNASRTQQLADSGLLFGCLRVPGAVDVIVLQADLRADRVSASVGIPAPRGEMRPTTRINWLLRQLPDSAPDAVRIEAALAGGRGASTVNLLGKLRTQPELLIPADQREIRSFTLSLDMPMGSKRAAGTGTLIHSVKSVTTAFYADVVQHLRPWTPRGA